MTDNPTPPRRPAHGGARGLFAWPGAVVGTYREAFAGLPRRVWWLSLVVFVHRSGTMVLPFLALYLTGRLGVSVEMSGVALGVWGLGSVAGTYAGGRLTDRFGSTAVQVVSLVVAAVSLAGLGWLRTPGLFFAGLFVAAFFVDAFRPANGVAVAEASRPDQLSRAYALRRQAINLGMTFGPVVGGLLARVDYLWLFVGDGGTCLAAALLLGWLAGTARGRAAMGERPGVEGVTPAGAGTGGAVPVDDEPAPVTAPDREPMRDPPFLVFLVLIGLVSAVLFQFLSAFPLALRDAYGMDELGIGLVFAVNTAIILVSEMVLTHRLAGVAPLRVVGWGALAVGVGYALTGFGSTFLWAAVVMAVVTVGEMLAMPQGETFVAQRAAGGRIGHYMGIFNVAFAVALTGGPALGTWIYGRFGPDVLWAVCGVSGVVLWLAFELLQRRLERSGDI